jgi:ParB-like chromosome segregation protein Spo0J
MTECATDETKSVISSTDIPARRLQLTSSASTSVAISELLEGRSPRSRPVDESHVQALVEVVNHLPPIVVHRASHTVIDGRHRLEACRRAGRDRIQVVFFDGSDDDAFVLSVGLNVSHGLALTTRERRAAAKRILIAAPTRSDRWVAQVCGMSHTTVANVRRELCLNEDVPAVAARVGSDGRLRAVRSAASARVVGLNARSATDDRPAPPPAPALPRDDALGALPGLDGFRELIARTDMLAEEAERYLSAVPLGWMYEVADECRRRAKTWADLATRAESRVHARKHRD